MEQAPNSQPKKVEHPDFSEASKKQRGISVAKNLVPGESRVINTNEEGENILEARRIDKGILNARGIGMQGQKIEAKKARDIARGGFASYLPNREGPIEEEEAQAHVFIEKATPVGKDRSEPRSTTMSEEQSTLLEFPKKIDYTSAEMKPKQSGFIGRMRELFNSWSGGGVDEHGEKDDPRVARITSFKKDRIHKETE